MLELVALGQGKSGPATAGKRDGKNQKAVGTYERDSVRGFYLLWVMRGGLAASKSREKKKRNACTSHFKGSAPPLLFESFASFRNFGQRATSPSPKGANEVRPPWSVRGPKCKLDFSEYALPQSV